MGKLITCCLKIYVNIKHSHSHSSNSDARISDENICTAVHRSPLNTGQAPFDAYQISSQKANLNIFIFIYFDTALEGTAYNYRDCCKQYLMPLRDLLSIRHAQQLPFKTSRVYILRSLFISSNMFKAFSHF